MGRKADMLTCESSGDTVSFQNWLSSAQNQQSLKDKRNLNTEFPLVSCLPTKPLPAYKTPPDTLPSPLSFGFIQITWMPSVQLQAESWVSWSPLITHGPSMSSFKHCLKMNTFSSEVLYAQVCKWRKLLSCLMTAWMAVSSFSGKADLLVSSGWLRDGCCRGYSSSRCPQCPSAEPSLLLSVRGLTQLNRGNPDSTSFPQ